MYDRSTIIVTRLLSLPDNIRALLSVARPSNTRHNIIIIHSNWRFFPAYFFAFCRIVIDIPRAATAVLCLLTLRKTHLQFEQFRVGTFEASESIFFASRASHDTADGKFASKPFSFDRSKKRRKFAFEDAVLMPKLSRLSSSSFRLFDFRLLLSYVDADEWIEQ